MFVTFENWLPLVDFDNADWIRHHWVEMCLKKCASEIREATKKEREGNNSPAMYLGERPDKMVRSNLPELPNTIFRVIIR